MIRKILSKKMKFNFVSLFIFLLLINSSTLLIENGSAQKTNDTIHYVQSGGEGNFTTIETAIDTAQAGDTIIVLNGTYYENIVIDKQLSLIGIDKNTTILDGRQTGNVIKINAENVTIKGFTIMHSGIYFPNSGINISSNYNTIQDNIILNNFYGITLYKSSNNTIQQNTIQDNDHCGIYMTNSSINSILQNILRDHNYNGIGIYESSDFNIIKNNTFIQNGYCGINIRISSMNIIGGNNISNNNIGIHVPQMENQIDENYFSKNRIDIEEESTIPGFEIVSFLCIVLIILIVFFIKKR